MHPTSSEITLRRTSQGELLLLQLTASEHTPEALIQCAHRLVESTLDIGAAPHRFIQLRVTLARGRSLSEREFFEHLASIDGTADTARAYARSLNPRIWADQHESPWAGPLWHDDGYAAGCFAVIPYALRSPAHLDMLVEHLDARDPEEESFHSRLVHVLWRRHGWCPPMVDFLARRATYLQGETGYRDLVDAAVHGRLTEHLIDTNRVDDFVELLRRHAARVTHSVGAEDREAVVNDAIEAAYLNDLVGLARKRAQEADMDSRFPNRSPWRHLGPEEWDDLP